MFRRRVSPRKKITAKKLLFSRMTGLLAKLHRYGQITGTHSLRVNRERVELSRVSFDPPLRILHLADFHASPVVPYRFIERAVDLGVSLKPDLICLTGDFVTHRIPESRERYAAILRKLSAAAPTFSCLGNHDCCYPTADPRQYRDTLGVGELLRQSGIRILFNAAVTLNFRGRDLRLAGLGDYSSRTMDPRGVLAEKKGALNNGTGESGDCCVPVVSQKSGEGEGDIWQESPPGAGSGRTGRQKSGASEGTPTILLSHNPDTKDFLHDYQWDLMLCGHTHGGQFTFPLLGTPFAPVRDRRFIQGLHYWEDRWIHVTRGVGNVHGLRINCPPQVSLIEVG